MKGGTVMAQEFNLEVIPGMEELTTRLEEDLIPAFRMVKDEIVEIGEFTGMPKLIASCKESETAGEQMLKTCDEIVEVFRNYIDKYKKIGEATGAL